jgi:hypothetical protein
LRLDLLQGRLTFAESALRRLLLLLASLAIRCRGGLRLSQSLLCRAEFGGQSLAGRRCGGGTTLAGQRRLVRVTAADAG